MGGGRGFASLLADRILPDVGGDLFDGDIGAEDVIVVAHFPERGLMDFVEVEGRALFESADEFEETAGVCEGGDQEVDVVGHETVGVELEIVSGGGLQKCGQNVGGGFAGLEMRLAVVAADGDEVGLPARVVSRVAGGYCGGLVS
jgi:hypothetical protein